MNGKLPLPKCTSFQFMACCSHIVRCMQRQLQIISFPFLFVDIEVIELLFTLLETRLCIFESYDLGTMRAAAKVVSGQN